MEKHSKEYIKERKQWILFCVGLAAVIVPITLVMEYTTPWEWMIAAPFVVDVVLIAVVPLAAIWLILAWFQFVFKD